MDNIFDQLTANKNLTADKESILNNETESSNDHELFANEAQYTPKQIKEAAQELIKNGIIEASNKSTLYQVSISNHAAINHVLEPFDLKMKVDDIRGLSYVTVENQTPIENGDDEWTHPLVRKQRLNLEQSLLIAILRKHFIAHELEAGVGDSAAAIHLDDILPELNSYLGELGSEMREDKRLRNLLEQLKNYGLVTEINQHDQITIRPLIAHVANPENLKSLLADFINATNAAYATKEQST